MLGAHARAVVQDGVGMVVLAHVGEAIIDAVLRIKVQIQGGDAGGGAVQGAGDAQGHQGGHVAGVLLVAHEEAVAHLAPYHILAQNSVTQQPRTSIYIYLKR